MAIDTARRRAAMDPAPAPLPRRPPPAPRRVLWAVGIVVVVVAAALAAILEWSGASLSADPAALASVSVGPLAGKLESVRAYGADGKSVPITVHGSRITPRAGVVAPGERVTVRVVVHRPGALSWLLGAARHERLVIAAPEAKLADTRLTVPRGSSPRVRFDRPVVAVGFGTGGVRHELTRPRSTLVAPSRAVAGTLRVAAAPRPWERLGAPQRLIWFPPTHSPAVVVSPHAGAKITPTTPLRLSFSKPVAEVLGSGKPTVEPSTPGHWSRPDDYTLTFTPSGVGAALGSDVHVRLPHSVSAISASGASRTVGLIGWTVPPGSTLRLHQILARLGYLPVSWKPAGAAVAPALPAQVRAAVEPPKGSFTWRYPNTPAPLRALWSPGHANDVTRGAVMTFQNTHGLGVDGFAGPRVWKALLADAVKGKRIGRGYNYVYVHRDLPQTLVLWHDGHTVLTTPGNTGVSAAPTALGTFPVFEHLAETTMAGTNPDGSHYSDPGIKWVSYFNGGDAVHAFDRASFGTPQSLGCVELPLAAAAKVFPYMPIGTLVTIEP